MSNLLGTALIEKQLCEALTALWDGPLYPDLLENIETCLRAIMTSQSLEVSRISSFWSDNFDGKRIYTDYEYDYPFNDSCLDYEFQKPREPHAFEILCKKESRFLIDLASTKICAEALAVVPQWVKRKGEAFAFLDLWYKGFTRRECEEFGRLMHRWEQYDDAYKGQESLQDNPLFHASPEHHAHYLVGSHRAGLLCYGNSPMAKICSEFIFSIWPNHLFEKLDEEYKKYTRSLQGPGIGLPFPPLTALVLSRAANREAIPRAIVDLREEFAEDRDRLWELLGEMWYAPNVRIQISILNDLKSAADSIFKAAFPERVNVLSVALSVVRTATSSPTDIIDSIGEIGAYQSRVSAVSFADRLASNLRSHLLNQVHLLDRHLTKSELVEFGQG